MQYSTFRSVLCRASCVLSLIPCLAAEAQAAAWTQEEGKALLITSANYYSADHLWNNGGTKVKQSRYSKAELSPYLEYGLTDWLTLGGNLSFQRAAQSRMSHASMGDTELFARTRLWQKDALVVSAAPLLKLPSPSSSSRSPTIGSRHPDAGLQLSAGYGFDAFGQHHYVALDGSYRYRFGLPRDQMRFDATLGIGVAPQWTVMPQLFLTRRASAPTTPTFTQSSGDDYNLATLQLSGVYDLRKDVAIQAGGYSNLAGKNVGSGSGGLIAVWKRF